MSEYAIMAVWLDLTWQGLFDPPPFGEVGLYFNYVKRWPTRCGVGVPVESPRGLAEFSVHIS